MQAHEVENLKGAFFHEYEDMRRITGSNQVVPVKGSLFIYADFVFDEPPSWLLKRHFGLNSKYRGWEAALAYLVIRKYKRE